MTNHIKVERMTNFIQMLHLSESNMSDMYYGEQLKLNLKQNLRTELQL